jgi:hypothetical protein
LASGKLSGKWKLLNKETFLARGNFLERTYGLGGKLPPRERLLDKRDIFWGKQDKTFYIGEGFGYKQNGLLGKWGNF